MNRKRRKNHKTLKHRNEIDFQTESCKSNGMMWAFICEALVTQKYGSSLHYVGIVGRKYIFAVQAINQKVFRSQETLQKDSSWAVFLEYGDLKGRNRPISSVDYTKLRSNFFNAIVKCTCDGIIKRLDHQTASLLLEVLHVTRSKNHKYFSYEGSQPPTLEYFKHSQTISWPKLKRRRLHVNAVELFKLDQPLEPGEYAFTAKVGADGLVENTKLLGPYGGRAQIPKFKESESNGLERKEDSELKIDHLSDYSSDDNAVTEGEETSYPVIKFELDEEIWESTCCNYSRTTEEEIGRLLINPIVDVNIGGHCKFPNIIIKQEDDEAELIIS